MELMIGIVTADGGIIWTKMPDSPETWEWIDQEIDNGVDLIVDRAY